MSVEHLKPHKKGDPKTGGKKKGYKSIKTVLKELCAGKIEIDDPITKTKRKISPHEAICLRMVMDAMEGDPRARQEYFNRMEGKPVEKVDMKTTAFYDQETAQKIEEFKKRADRKAKKEN
jgi:hypothetical protein